MPPSPATVHAMLDFKPAWVEACVHEHDQTFGEYPDTSLADWHAEHKLPR